MPPLALGTRIVVTGPSGQVQSGRPEFDNRVGQALQPGAPAGSYEVIWRVSSDDGHPVSGRLSFTVRAAGSEQSFVEASPAANSQSANPLPHAQQQGSDSAGYTVLWVAAGLVALAAIAYSLLRQPLRRRTS